MRWRKAVAWGLRGLGVLLIVPAGLSLAGAVLATGGRWDFFVALLGLVSLLFWGLSFLCFWSASGLLRGKRLAALGAVVAVVVGVAAVWLVVDTLFEPVALKAHLAADQGTLAAMRAAIAIYYGQSGTFPDHPGHYVNPSPPNFVCVNLAYVYSPTTGELKITSTNTVADCP